MYQTPIDHTALNNLESITRLIHTIMWDSLGVLLKMCDTLELYWFKHPLHYPWGITRPIDVNSLLQPPTVCAGPFIQLSVYLSPSLPLYSLSIYSLANEEDIDRPDRGHPCGIAEPGAVRWLGVARCMWSCFCFVSLCFVFFSIATCGNKPSTSIRHDSSRRRY